MSGLFLRWQEPKQPALAPHSRSWWDLRNFIIILFMSSPLFPWVEPQQSNLSRLKRRHGNLSSSTRHNVTGHRQDYQDVVMNALSVLEYIKGMEQSMVVMCMIEMKG